MNPQTYLQHLEQGTKPTEQVAGLHGRIIRGHKPEDFRTLSNDPNRLLVYLTDSDGLASLLGHSTTHAMLKAVGYDDGHIGRLAADGTQFKVVVFPESESYSADWDGLLDLTAEVYPETKQSVEQYRERFKTTPYAHFEVMAGFAFGDHDKPEDDRFMTYERWQVSTRNFVDLRRLLYHAVHVRELFRGDGYTEGPDGQRNVREYLLPNKVITDIVGAVVADLSPLDLP